MITTLPTRPTRNEAPADFIAKADARLAALPQLGYEVAAHAAAFGVELWVSGTNYDAGDLVFSPSDFRPYRRKTNGAGTTDPSADSTNWALRTPPRVSINTRPSLLENVGLSVEMNTPSANQCRVSLKDAQGGAPSASNKVGVSFRSATITDGASSKVEVTAANSVTISSGGTLGAGASLEPQRVWVAGILFGGAVELAVCTTRGSNGSITAFNEDGLISTTAMSSGADSAQVWYSANARSNVPFTILGYFESAQVTAGAWVTAASAVVVNPQRRPGDVVQVQQVVKTDPFTTTSTTMADVTGVSLPDARLSLANVLDVSFSGMVSNGTVANNTKGNIVIAGAAQFAGAAAGSRTSCTFGSHNVTGGSILYVFHWNLDKARFASNLSYGEIKLQMQTLSAGTATLGRDGSDTDIDDSPRTATVLTVEEIMA
jgi:hypothetical protein